jgi:hypothetical protein
MQQNKSLLNVIASNFYFNIGNLVVNRPAAQRMILHSIPKKQIVPDPNGSDSTKSQKRGAEYVSSDEDSSSEESLGEPTKKLKRKKCKSPGAEEY